MRTARKEIAVLVKDKKIIKFLEGFFQKRRVYKATYFQNQTVFLTLLEEAPPSAIITETSQLESIADKTTKFPHIAIITGDIREGIDTAILHNVNSYIYKPYLDKDLDYKLEHVITGNELLVQLKNEIKELEVVTELTQLITSSLDPKEILYKIVKQISDTINVTRCSIVRVDWLRRSAFVVATFEDPNLTGIKLNLRKYPEIMEALTSKKPVVIKDILTDPLMQAVRDILQPMGIRSILVIPIVFREKVIGTLFLRTSVKGRTFSENEVRLLNAIASASANALYNAFMFEQVEDEKTRLEKLAITDYLTGIYNIRYFYHRIIEEFSRSQRYDFPISCLMLDIDHFKKINDIYGHKTGDLVLREFAQLIKKHSRKSDVVARYGGEEFIMLLPQTSLEGALLEAERIRTSIDGHVFKSFKETRKLTISIGIASYPNKKIKSHDDLISCSDDALFNAKKSGRNKVEIYGK